ncbi:MAG: CDP-archaeol synthase [Dehalococcoidia bacterium]|jgi:phosphatidate cytidylyltransferase|nr:CDP-archaeol synthase [Dehalococcoidia bacterium]
MIRQRVLSALVLILVIFIAVWFGGPFYYLLLALVAALGALEFFGILGLSYRHPLTVFGLLCVLLLIVSAYYKEPETFEDPYTAPIMAGAVVFSLIWLLSRRAGNALVNWVWTLAGIIYIGWMLSHFIPLRALDDGREWVLFLLFATFATDTAAFFCGRAWGKRSLAPVISPGKTWEGALGGLLAAIAASLILATILNLPIPYWQVTILGILIGIFAQLGDLSESLLKRSAGVKESGTLIPGHGGLLDRLDSVVFTVVVVYYYVIWVVV